MHEKKLCMCSCFKEEIEVSLTHMVHKMDPHSNFDYTKHNFSKMLFLFPAVVICCVKLSHINTIFQRKKLL